MKVALVHDYLREYGGAERVLEALHDMWPEAPIYTAYYRPRGLGPHRERIKKWDIQSSWLQYLPFANPLISPLRLIAPLIFESFDLKKYDLVISSTAVYFAKAVLTRPDALHISYIHTPPRYLYGYATPTNLYNNPIKGFLVSLMNHFLRLWDYQTSQRPDLIVVNSKNVAQRVKKFYRREATVIYPPVDIEQFKNAVTAEKGDYFISLNRLYPEKNIDLIVKTCNQLGLSLKVVGVGPQLRALKKLAGKTVEFLGEVTDEDKVALLAKAKATILASKDEDFGIVPVESMAAGTPVIALRAGGYLESVVEGQTGEFFDELTEESLTKVLKSFDETKYSRADLQKQAEKFSQERFKKEVLALVEANKQGKV